MIGEHALERLLPAKRLRAADGEMNGVAALRQFTDNRLVDEERAEVLHREKDPHRPCHLVYGTSSPLRHTRNAWRRIFVRFISQRDGRMKSRRTTRAATR